MTNVSKKKRLIIERYNKRMLGEAEMDCPKSTKDSDLNEKNKKKIADNNQYGLPTKEAKEKDKVVLTVLPLIFQKE